MTAVPAMPGGGASLRLDRLLWFLRFCGSRAAAQQWVESGHIRANGRRVTKTAHPVRAGDVLTLPLARQVLVIRIMTLPLRRGPAPDARACYAIIADEGAAGESDSQRGEVIDAPAPTVLGGGV